MHSPVVAQLSRSPAVRGEPLQRQGEGASAVHLLNFRWLTALRWVAVIGQTIAIFCVTVGLGLELPLAPIAWIIGAEFLLNLCAWRRGRTQAGLHELELAAWVGLDLVAFTSLLYFTGGPSNPFSFFYIVHVAMAALTLHASYAWSLVLLSTLSFAGLFVWHVPLQAQDYDWDLHLHGLWVAYSLGASCVVYFLQRARATIAEREEELAVQRKLTEQTERLSSLATLAAGAAHELASPLGTIAVVSKELALDLKRAGNTDALDDVELVRSQVERCRKILARLAHTAGEAPGEIDTWILLPVLFEHALGEVAEHERIELTIDSSLAQAELRGPKEALCQALRVLVDNALEATASTVTLRAQQHERGLAITVTDRGLGMSATVLERAFEPFFTTKPTGKGMGLGLYLARNVVLSLRGALTLRSHVGRGTTAEIQLPSDRLRIPKPAPPSRPPPSRPPSSSA